MALQPQDIVKKTHIKCHDNMNEVIAIYIATYFVASALENVVSGKWCRIQKFDLM